MAKARSLVGLDVHATKVVAAVLDAETGQLQMFAMSGETAKAAAFCAGLPKPVRAAYEAGPTGYGRASSQSVALSAWSRRQARSRAQPVIESKPTVVTLNTSSGCYWPASCTRFGCLAMRKRRCVTWSALARRCGWT